MNAAEAENGFRLALKRLVQEVQLDFEALGKTAYLEANDGEQTVLEAPTRALFVDRLLEQLGWNLALGGNVAQEVRVQAETTCFMDYVGLSADRVAPVLVVEAKAWDKPMVAPRTSGQRPVANEALIADAIAHLRNDGARAKSPVVGVWYDYLEQVLGYVDDLKTRHGHDVPRVLLTSGRWVVIFKTPAATFLGPGAPQARDILVVEMDEYDVYSTQLYDLLARDRLGPVVPKVLRPSQLAAYLPAGTLVAVYRALHLRYGEQRMSFFAPQPSFWASAALIFERDDGALLRVIDDDGSALQNGARVNDHLAAINAAALALNDICAREIGAAIAPSPLSRFKGFPPKPGERLVGNRKLVESDGEAWLLATGEATHYLGHPAAIWCGFHNWANCGSATADSVAVAAPSPGLPSTFFVDGDDQHCAHRDQADYRDPKCHIQQIERRPCCQACVYRAECWPAGAASTWACGASPAP